MLKKLLPLVWLFIVLHNCAFAGADIVVESLVHDFGQLIEGESYSYTYRFQNAGDEPLEISNLRASCGCTAALLSTHLVAPGALGELRINFDSKGFRGRVEKVVSFRTNDPQHSDIGFRLKGLVKPQLFVSPLRINWGRVKAGTRLNRELEIINDANREIHLERPQVTHAGLNAEISSTQIMPGERVFLSVKAIFPEGNKRLAGYIIIKTDFSSVPVLKIPVSARLALDK